MWVGVAMAAVAFGYLLVAGPRRTVTGVRTDGDREIVTV